MERTEGRFLHRRVHCAQKANKVLGKDVLTFRREDGAAENFHREQNRDLLGNWRKQTGSYYYSLGC